MTEAKSRKRNTCSMDTLQNGVWHDTKSWQTECQKMIKIVRGYHSKGNRNLEGERQEKVGKNIYRKDSLFGL